MYIYFFNILPQPGIELAPNSFTCDVTPRSEAKAQMIKDRFAKAFPAGGMDSAIYNQLLSSGKALMYLEFRTHLHFSPNIEQALIIFYFYFIPTIGRLICIALIRKYSEF